MIHLLKSCELKDTQNQSWADDKSGFGFKMMMKMGWKEGKGLGKNESGITDNIKIRKKIDSRGIGAEFDTTGNNGWALQAQDFNGLQQSLLGKYGSTKSVEKKKKEVKRKHNGDNKEDRKRRKNEISETNGKAMGDEGSKEIGDTLRSDKGDKRETSSNSSTLRKKISKKERRKNNAGKNRDINQSSSCTASGKVCSEMEAKSSNVAPTASKTRAKSKNKKSDVSKEKATLARASRHRMGRARHIKSKNTGGYSSKEMAAVLGVAVATQ